MKKQFFEAKYIRPKKGLPGKGFDYNKAELFEQFEKEETKKFIENEFPIEATLEAMYDASIIKGERK